MYEKRIEHNGIDYLFCDLREKYVNQTALLLNSEWPRSLAQRHLNLRSLLDKSTTYNDKNLLKVPISLILISSKDDQVIGHASLVRIEAIFDHESNIQQSTMSKRENQAFLQSVLIHKDFRGMHLGKRLMQLCEEYFLTFALNQEQQNKESEESENSSPVALGVKVKSARQPFSCTPECAPNVLIPRTSAARSFRAAKDAMERSNVAASRSVSRTPASRSALQASSKRVFLSASEYSACTFFHSPRKLKVNFRSFRIRTYGTDPLTR